jgi:sigma-B regulation protein RsbU (phosphoserine phosphatase)
VAEWHVECNRRLIVIVTPLSPRSRTLPLRVLVVEDDDDARAVVTMAVRSLGHRCSSVPDAERASEALAHDDVDVVICDWELPDSNAVELCRRTRSIAGRDYVFFLIVSGYDDRERLVEAATAGADDFQRKPIDLGELEMRLILAARALDARRRLDLGKGARPRKGRA